jgi:hypothetical protein
MAIKHIEFTWHTADVLAAIDKLALEYIDKLALEVIAESDPPIDTGYLDASAYVSSSSGLNTFNTTWAAGKFMGRRSRALVRRQRVQTPASPPKNGAVVGWAADYAAQVEEKRPFAYAALQRVARRHKR